MYISHLRNVRSHLHLCQCGFKAPNEVMGAADVMVVTVDLKVTLISQSM